MSSWGQWQEPDGILKHVLNMSDPSCQELVTKDVLDGGRATCGPLQLAKVPLRGNRLVALVVASFFAVASVPKNLETKSFVRASASWS